MVADNEVRKVSGNHCFIGVLRAIISDPRIDFDLFLVHNYVPVDSKYIIREGKTPFLIFLFTVYFTKGDFMKTMATMVILVIALYLSGCVTTQSTGKASSDSGSASGGGSAAVSSGSKSGKMLTKEDYDRIGIKEMGSK